MKKFLLLSFICGSLTPVFAQNSGINQDESKVPAYTLPDVLTCRDGEKVTSAARWEQKRRPELLALFANQMYGENFADYAGMNRSCEVLTEQPDALGGKAICRQVKITFTRGNVVREALLLIYLPKTVKGKVPVFLSYNYNGNHTISTDPKILASPSSAAFSSGDPDSERGNRARRWPLELIANEGFAVVTFCYHDVFPDSKTMKDESMLALASDYEAKKHDPHSTQALGAWAWGFSRIVDYLETVDEIDSKRIVLMGHSRQGKAALWAGAQDPRFAIVISNNSGCGGAALSLRRFGENLHAITTGAPHWFCAEFVQYANNEESLPFDQHELIALMAPRPVYIASAQEDLWADPKGEYLSGYHAGPVYALYGLKGLAKHEMPEVNAPLTHHHIGYHIRSGVHDVTDFDWKCFIRFAKKHFSKE
ncbi:MAG: acetylxylan esterase [Tannerella sp.]|jgi:hypothetical protein|nr:acetylxylan esterase [Tannerella sp.]